MNLPAATELEFDKVQALVVLRSQRLLEEARGEALFELLIAGIYPLMACQHLWQKLRRPRHDIQQEPVSLLGSVCVNMLGAMLVGIFLLPRDVLLPIAAGWAAVSLTAGAGLFIFITRLAHADRRRRQAEWLATDTSPEGDTPALHTEEQAGSAFFLLNAPVRGLYLIDSKLTDVAYLPPCACDDPEVSPAPAYFTWKDGEDEVLRCRYIYRLEAGRHRLPAGMPAAAFGPEPPTLLHAPYKEKAES